MHCGDVVYIRILHYNDAGRTAKKIGEHTARGGNFYFARRDFYQPPPADPAAISPPTDRIHTRTHRHAHTQRTRNRRGRGSCKTVAARAPPTTVGISTVSRALCIVILLLSQRHGVTAPGGLRGARRVRPPPQRRIRRLVVGGRWRARASAYVQQRYRVAPAPAPENHSQSTRRQQRRAYQRQPLPSAVGLSRYVRDPIVSFTRTFIYYFISFSKFS